MGLADEQVQVIEQRWRNVRVLEMPRGDRDGFLESPEAKQRSGMDMRHFRRILLRSDHGFQDGERFLKVSLPLQSFGFPDEGHEVIGLEAEEFLKSANCLPESPLGLTQLGKAELGGGLFRGEFETLFKYGSASSKL